MGITLSKSNNLPWYWQETLKMTQVGYSFKFHPYFSFICFCSYIFIQYFPSKYSIHLGVRFLPKKLIPSSSHTFMLSRSLFAFDNGCPLSMNWRRLSRWFKAFCLTTVATFISSFHWKKGQYVCTYTHIGWFKVRSLQKPANICNHIGQFQVGYCNNQNLCIPSRY